MPEGNKTNWFTILITLSCLAVVIESFYTFFYQKNYDFIVETACDPTQEECIVRDCSNPDDCPPNQLSEFKRYYVNADDFVQCANEDCRQVCESGIIECEQITCEEDEEYSESCSMIGETMEEMETLETETAPL